MKSKEKMISKLPIYERENEVIEDIYTTFGDKTDQFLYEIEDLYKQMNIDTATWGLDTWERNVGLDNNQELTITQRRGRVKSRLKSFSKIDTELLRDVIQDYYENEVRVSFNGRVLFEFPLEGDSWEFRPIVEEIIRILKPTHLGYEISIYTVPVHTGFYLGTRAEAGEEITIYPGVTRDILLEPAANIGFSYETIMETITVYPKITWDTEIYNIETYAGLAYGSILEEVTMIGMKEE